jgi:hypothetical protein
MRRLLACLLLAGPALANAQATEDRLKDAIDKYTAFNIEGARPILLQIVSPNYLLSVTTEQKVRA